MAGIFEQIKEKPWTGWAMAGVLLVALVVVVIRLKSAGGDEFSGASLGEWVVVRYTDTDEDEKMTRGELLKRMLATPKGSLGADTGILNPKTGKPTGFLHDKATWQSLVRDVNAEREAVSAQPKQESKPK